ncbi:MAG: hypothetical protein E7675_02360 [Ruminococcaceae bacterium]|nr:hypothetical protein [Oscillospiraceae bacterium]
MKKQIIGIILSICMLVSSITMLSISSYAEDSRYNELMAQKKEYLAEHKNYGGELYYLSPLITPQITVLFYTDVANELTFEVHNGYTEDHYLNAFLRKGGYSGQYFCFIISPELEQVTSKSKFLGESRSALRDCIKYFDISKEELLEAFKTMKEDPDAIRPLFDFLTDEEYESMKEPDGTFGSADWPEFVIEAMFIEDDKKAHDLINYPYAVYVPELERVLTNHEIDRAHMWNINEYTTVDKLLTFDLTSDTMGEFIQYIKRNNYLNIYITSEHLSLLEKERARQLAVETGEELIFIPLAVVSFAGAVAIVSPKLRRKLKKAE